MQVEECAKPIVRRRQQLQAECVFVEAAQCVRFTGETVIDPVVPVLAQQGNTRHQRFTLVERAAQSALDIERAEAADSRGCITAELSGRPARFELENAGRRVASEQCALRAAQYFNAVEVE